jgi:hypothetical protein
VPKKITADELIWLFHEKLAGTNMSNAGIAIIPTADGNWFAVTSGKERRHYPNLASAVARIERQLRARFSVR